MKISISGKRAAAVLLPPAGSPSLVLPNLFIGYFYYARYRHSVISTSCRYSISYFVDNETLYSDMLRVRHFDIHVLYSSSCMLTFRYVLAGWKGSSHDRAVLEAVFDAEFAVP